MRTKEQIMKNKFFAFFLCLALAAIATSCNKDEEGPFDVTFRHEILFDWSYVPNGTLVNLEITLQGADGTYITDKYALNVDKNDNRTKQYFSNYILNNGNYAIKILAYTYVNDKYLHAEERHGTFINNDYGIVETYSSLELL